jgi:hypothetical protein
VLNYAWPPHGQGSKGQHCLCMACTAQEQEGQRILAATLTREPAATAPQPPGVGPNDDTHHTTRPLEQISRDWDYR